MLERRVCSGRMFRPALVCALALLTTPARADAPECRRAEAADRQWQAGQSASEAGDHATAARSYARADELCPHVDALDRALKEVELADEPLLCTELVDRALARGYRPTTTRALGAACRSKLAGIVVRCPGSVCTATIDG